MLVNCGKVIDLVVNLGGEVGIKVLTKNKI